MEVRREDFFVDGKPTKGFRSLLKEMNYNVLDFFEESEGRDLCAIEIGGTLVLGKGIAETDTHRGGRMVAKTDFLVVSATAGLIWEAAKKVGIPTPWKPLQLWIETRVW